MVCIDVYSRVYMCLQMAINMTKIHTPIHTSYTRIHIQCPCVYSRGVHASMNSRVYTLETSCISMYFHVCVRRRELHMYTCPNSWCVHTCMFMLMVAGAPTDTWNVFIGIHVFTCIYTQPIWRVCPCMCMHGTCNVYTCIHVIAPSCTGM